MSGAGSSAGSHKALFKKSTLKRPAVAPPSLDAIPAWDPSDLSRLGVFNSAIQSRTKAQRLGSQIGAEIAAEIVIGSGVSSGSFIRGILPKTLVPLFRGFSFSQDPLIYSQQLKATKPYPPELSRETFLRAKKRAKKEGFALERGFAELENYPAIERALLDTRADCLKIHGMPSEHGIGRSLLMDWYERFFLSMMGHQAEDLKKIREPIFEGTPFLSFTEWVPEAVRYGSGARNTQENYPRYRSNGSLEQSVIGVVYIALVPPEEIAERGLQLRKSIETSLIGANPLFMHNVEVTFLGGLESRYLVQRQCLRFPDLSKPYKAKYLEKYGLSSADYLEAKTRLDFEFRTEGAVKPHSNPDQYQASLLGFLTEKLIGILCAKLFQKAFDKAAKQGAKLVALMPDGTLSPDFSHIVPPSSKDLSLAKAAFSQQFVQRVIQESQKDIGVSSIASLGMLPVYHRYFSYLQTLLTRLVAPSGARLYCPFKKRGFGLSTAFLALRQGIAKQEGEHFLPILLTHEHLMSLPQAPKRGKDKNNQERWAFELFLRTQDRAGLVPLPAQIDSVIAEMKKRELVWLLESVLTPATYSAPVQHMLNWIMSQSRVILGTYAGGISQAPGLERPSLPIRNSHLNYDMVEHIHLEHPLVRRIGSKDLAQKIKNISAWLQSFNNTPEALWFLTDQVLNQPKKNLSPFDFSIQFLKNLSSQTQAQIISPAISPAISPESTWLSINFWRIILRGSQGLAFSSFTGLDSDAHPDREDQLNQAIQTWISNRLIYQDPDSKKYCALASHHLLASLASFIPSRPDKAQEGYQKSLFNLIQDQGDLPKNSELSELSEWHELVWLYALELLEQKKFLILNSWLALLFAPKTAELLSALDLILQFKLITFLSDYLEKNPEFLSEIFNLDFIKKYNTQWAENFDLYLKTDLQNYAEKNLETAGILKAELAGADKFLAKLIAQRNCFTGPLLEFKNLEIAMIEILAHPEKISQELPRFIRWIAALGQFTPAILLAMDPILLSARSAEPAVNKIREAIYIAIGHAVNIQELDVWLLRLLINDLKVLTLSHYEPDKILDRRVLTIGYESNSRAILFYEIAASYREYGLPKEVLKNLIQNYEKLTSKTLIKICQLFSKHPKSSGSHSQHYLKFWKFVFEKSKGTEAGLIAQKELEKRGVNLLPRAALVIGAMAGAGGAADCAADCAVVC